MRETLSVGAVLTLLVLAGCQAPVSHQPVGRTPTSPPVAGTTPPTTAPPAPTITVRNGSLPIDPGPVFQRVQRLLRTNVTPPRYVRIVEEPENLTRGDQQVPRSWRLIGLRPGGLNASTVERLENGVTTGLGGIRLYVPPGASAAEVEWVLAHEFVHYVQLQTGLSATLAQKLPRTTDGQFVRRALSEGAATLVTDAYIERYGLDTRPNSAVYRDLRGEVLNGSVAEYTNDAYLTGYRYLQRQGVEPRDLDAVLTDPPLSSAELLGATPAVVTANRTAPGGRWHRVGTDHLGMAFLRTLLHRSVQRDRATALATDLSNDTLDVYRHPNATQAGYVWRVRMQESVASEQILEILRAQADARGTQVGPTRWRLNRTRIAIARLRGTWIRVAIGPSSFITGIATTDQRGET